MKTELLKKIFEAKKIIASSNLKKAGRNNFAKYDYFTPEQITTIVNNACFELNLLTEFRITHDTDLGFSSRFSIIDIETGEVRDYEFPAILPEIKGANESQRIGGAITYFERYCKMSVFGIVDNNLDFDATEDNNNTKPPKTPPSKPEILVIDAVNEMNKCKTLTELKACWSKYPQFQKNSEFIKSKDTLKLKLK